MQIPATARLGKCWELHGASSSTFTRGRCRVGECDLSQCCILPCSLRRRNRPSICSCCISQLTQLHSQQARDNLGMERLTGDCRHQASQGPAYCSFTPHTPRRRKESTRKCCVPLHTHLFKKALPKALSFLKGFLGSTTRAFPGMIPSMSPCITAMKESVVGSGPILMPGKSCSSRYLARRSTVLTQAFCSKINTACLL